jgi:transcription elongation factor GreA
MKSSRIWITAPTLERIKKQRDRLEAQRRELASWLTHRVSPRRPDRSQLRTPTLQAELAATVAHLAALEEFIADAQVVDGLQAPSTVTIGSAVTVEDVAIGAASTYTIVSPLDSDPDTGRISCLSPIGAALVGRQPAEEIDVNVPAGRLRLRIVSVGDVRIPARRSAGARRPARARRIVPARGEAAPR